MNKTPQFSKGDLVLFRDSAQLYRWYEQWAKKHGLYNWAKECAPELNTKGYVVAVGIHTENPERILYGVAIDGKTYVIGEESLRSVNDYITYLLRRKRIVEGLLRNATNTVEVLLVELKEIDKELNS